MADRHEHARPNRRGWRAAAVAAAVLVAGCSGSSSAKDGTTGTTGPAISAADPDGDGATVPPGGALPTDAECAARVVAAPEVRAVNAEFNATRGSQKAIPEPWLNRVTGDFSGTTDEILQWGACKWGVDLDLVRAQAAKESYWDMTAAGDFTADVAACAPGHAVGADGEDGQCPESIGLLQVRYQYHGPPAGRNTWPEAARSTAYNVDYTYAIWRSCYEGDLTWLNATDKGGEYAAGDGWSCIGVWFSGRWLTEPARTYIEAVRTYRDDRIWETSSFENAG